MCGQLDSDWVIQQELFQASLVTVDDRYTR